MDAMNVVFLVCVYLVVMGGTGIYLAECKGRGSIEGIFFSIVGGPLGWIVIACLPTLGQKPSSSVGP